MTNIVNLRTSSYDVYIGRQSQKDEGYFGNPFSVKDYGRAGAIAKYKEYFYARIESDSEFKFRVLALKGLTLGCFCKPSACHGDIIVEYLGAQLKAENTRQLKLI